MIKTILRDEKADFQWIDVVNPTPEDFEWLSESFKLHPAAVKDCLSPVHLPKYEIIGSTIFIIARVYDEAAKFDADTVQQLTNKVALFVSERFIISIHRKDEPFFLRLRAKWGGFRKDLEVSALHLLNDILDQCLQSYREPLREAHERLDQYEIKIFASQKTPEIIRELYSIRRRASVFKRMIGMMREALQHYLSRPDMDTPFGRDLLESAEYYVVMTEEVYETVDNLMNIYISLSSHRMNEIMGVLTMLSAFFLPLTFIAGLYGMNFDNMPELHTQYGYFGVLVSMGAVTGAIYWWFKKKGWL